MTPAELKNRIVSAAVARHRARSRLEASFGPGNKKQRERRKQYRIIDACERALSESAAELNDLGQETGSTINGLDDLCKSTPN